MATISIIVPVYKVESYLRRCVDSILRQTFPDFDLILVDDGSPDNCGAICGEYAAKDNRIHVIHQENGGLSAARNAGIDWAFANSDSQWLTFVDSDDWIHPEMLERLLNAAQKDCVSIAICGYQETAGEALNLQPEMLEPVLWTPDDYYLHHYVNATIACCKLYEKRCFTTLRYPVGKINEDEYLTYRILFQFSKITVISAPLYAYFMNPNGITKGTWLPRRLDVWGALEEQIAFFQENGKPELEKARYKAYLWNVVGQINEIHQTKNPQQFSAELKLAKQRKRELLKRMKKLKYQDIVEEYWKKTIMLFILGPELYQKWENVIEVFENGGIMGIIKKCKSKIM